MGNTDLKLKTLVAFERWSKQNVFELINKENKSATDLYFIAGINLFNNGVIKSFDELDNLDAEVLDKAIKDMTESMNVQKQ